MPDHHFMCARHRLTGRQLLDEWPSGGGMRGEALRKSTLSSANSYFMAVLASLFGSLEKAEFIARKRNLSRCLPAVQKVPIPVCQMKEQRETV